MMEAEKLSYFISEKNSIIVVNLIGTLEQGNAHILESCIQDLSKRNAKFVILSFRDVSGTMDHKLAPTMARLQKGVRDRRAELRIAAIHPELRESLNSRGLIRTEEICNNLADALKNIKLPVAA